MSKGQMAMAGVTPSTMVWKAGMSDWVKAESVPELSDIFMEDSAFGSYARPEEQLNPYNRIPDSEVPNPYGSQEEPRYPGAVRSPRRPSPYMGYGATNQPQQPMNAPVPHTNWLPWAIVGTIFGACFSCIGMIFGIIGIVKANKANSFYNQGMTADGDVANSSARVMTIVALVLGALGLVMVLTGTTTKIMQMAMNQQF